MPKTITGYHFAKLLDGQAVTNYGDPFPIHKGTRLTVNASMIEPCVYGLHASRTALSSLNYAQGPMISRVRLSGHIVPHGTPVNKYAASVRLHLTEPIDATDTFIAFARWCAQLTTWHAFAAAWAARAAAARDAQDAWDAAAEAQVAAAAARDAQDAQAARDAAARADINAKLEAMLGELLEE